MAQPDDLYIAEFALQKGLITREQLLEALWLITDGESPKPLAVFLVEKGLMEEAQLKSILRARTEGADRQGEEDPEEMTFGHVAVAIGIVTKEQLEECLAIQDATPEERRLGEILAERGYATPPQVRRALEYQRKSLFTCMVCGRRFNVLNAASGEAYPCKKCGGKLAPAHGGQVSAEDTVHIRKKRGRGDAIEELVGARMSEGLPLDEQSETDRALGLYLKEKELVRREDLRAAERLQLQFSRFGLFVPLFDILKRRGVVDESTAKKLEMVDFVKVVHGEDWTRQVVPGLTLSGRITTGDFTSIYAVGRMFSNSMAALKILHRDRASDPANVARLRKEANLLIRLNHPGILRAYEYDSVPPDLHYIIMEYVQGETIDQLVGTGGAMPPDKALAVTRQAAEALAYMDREGYVHRDVRPEHLLLDERGRVQICDVAFAVRRSRGKGAAKETTAKSAAFMSPEQARGDDDLSVASDIYSLGLTLYMMVTGRLLFDGQSSDAVMASRFDQDWAQVPVDLSGVSSSAVVVGLLQKMLDPGSARIDNYPDLFLAIDQCRAGS